MRAKCKSCGKKFAYKEVLKSICLSGQIIYDNCNEENEIGIRRSLITYGLIALSMGMELFKEELGVSSVAYGLIIVLYIALIIFVSPFFMKYE